MTNYYIDTTYNLRLDNYKIIIKDLYYTTKYIFYSMTAFTFIILFVPLLY